MDDARLVDPLTESLRTLNRLAKALKAKRAASGALSLASPEVRFVLDSETRDPTDVAMYNLKEANSMVEEFMLLANITVARQIAQAFPQHAILRRHPPPPPGAFDGLNHALRAHGFELDASSSFALSDSLDACTKPADPYFNKLVRILATRSMQQARYFSSGTLTPADYLHYGLAAPIYTHFTSPIRRYAALPSTSAAQHARAHHGALLPSPQVRGPDGAPAPRGHHPVGSGSTRSPRHERRDRAD